MGMDRKPSVWISSIYQNMSGQELLEVSLCFKNRVEDWDTREREREREREKWKQWLDFSQDLKE